MRPQRTTSRSSGSRRRPPVVHPLFLSHPITGRKVLYCNPGYTVRINQLSERESDDMLEYLFEFQLEPRFRYTHTWQPHDVLFWDNRSVNHARDSWDGRYLREMHRAQAGGSTPF